MINVWTEGWHGPQIEWIQPIRNSLRACIVWRFPCLPATARDSEIKMQHSCHHIETIRHPGSSYVTTKLLNVYMSMQRYYGLFMKSYFHVSYRWHMLGSWPGSGQALMIHAKVERWRQCWIHYFFVLKVSILPKYCVNNYYHYIVKWCSGI